MPIFTKEFEEYIQNPDAFPAFWQFTKEFEENIQNPDAFPVFWQFTKNFEEYMQNPNAFPPQVFSKVFEDYLQGKQVGDVYIEKDLISIIKGFGGRRWWW